MPKSGHMITWFIQKKNFSTEELQNLETLILVVNTIDDLFW